MPDFLINSILHSQSYSCKPVNPISDYIKRTNSMAKRSFFMLDTDLKRQANDDFNADEVTANARKSPGNGVLSLPE